MRRCNDAPSDGAANLANQTPLDLKEEKGPKTIIAGDLNMTFIDRQSIQTKYQQRNLKLYYGPARHVQNIIQGFETTGSFNQHLEHSLQ